mgnify:CR=1 FL=1
MRYNDDIIILGVDEQEVRMRALQVVHFVAEHLMLNIPPHKTEIIIIPAGVIDVLGICTDGYKK